MNLARVNGSQLKEDRDCILPPVSIEQTRPIQVDGNSNQYVLSRRKMQSVVFDQFGEPADVLQLQEQPIPEPGSGKVRVRMLASPVNPSDLLYIRGQYTTVPKLPATPGFEGVGIVETAGSGVLGKLLVGKRVAVLNSQTGNWSEKTVVPAKQAIPVPAGLSLEQAATFFINPASAFIMTRKVLKVPQNEWLLQTAAGSALGRMVIRLGMHFGFKTLCVVRRAERAEELKSLGATAVLVFDSEKDDANRFQEEVRRLTGGPGVPYIIDPVGGQTGSTVVSCLSKNGRMLVFGTLDDAPLNFSPRELMKAGSGIEGFWLGNYMARIGLVQKLKLVRQVAKLVKRGLLTSEIGKTYSLQDVSAAVLEAERPGRSGKVLLKIGIE